jgi:hypothetical protein
VTQENSVSRKAVTGTVSAKRAFSVKLPLLQCFTFSFSSANPTSYDYTLRMGYDRFHDRLPRQGMGRAGARRSALV